MKAYLIFFVLVVMILSAFLTACGNDVATTPSTALSQGESSSESILLSDVSQNESTEKTTLEILEEKVQSGEISGFKMSDEYHLVNKFVDATFENSAYYLWGVVDNTGEYVYPLAQKADFERLYGFPDISLQADMENIYNLKENMFLIEYQHGIPQNYQVLFYNAQEDTSFVLTVRNEVNSNIWQRISVPDLLEGFDNGFLVSEMSCGVGYHDQEYKPVIIGRDGTIVESDIVFDGSSKIFRADGTNSVGPYREGMFWAYGSFYDRDCKQVIDLTEYHVQNVPYFEDGRAELTILQNEKLWNVFIDETGTFLGDPVEINEPLE